jgi:hypothetical protein
MVGYWWCLVMAYVYYLYYIWFLQVILEVLILWNLYLDFNWFGVLHLLLKPHIYLFRIINYIFLRKLVPPRQLNIM